MIAAIIISAIALVIGFISIVFYGHDNPIEEFAEKILEEITGIEEIDLSPWEDESKEDKNVAGQ